MTSFPSQELARVTSAVQFADEVAALQAETRRLQRAGARVIIAVGHSGYPREKQMAEQIDGVDVIVGGHSHSLLHNGEDILTLCCITVRTFSPSPV